MDPIERNLAQVSERRLLKKLPEARDTEMRSNSGPGKEKFFDCKITINGKQRKIKVSVVGEPTSVTFRPKLNRKKTYSNNGKYCKKCGQMLEIRKNIRTKLRPDSANNITKSF